VPPSLAALYPPAAKEPVHLFAMLGLQDTLAGVAVDLLENDLAGAREGFARFEEAWRRAAALVPEWRDAYPEEPVRALGEALGGTDRGRTMEAYGAVGAACHRCHLTTMVPVQQRFRWGSFAAQTVADPAGGETLPYAAFKLRLATSLTGVAHDLRQGQLESARRQFQTFSDRFAALRGSCAACHRTARRSFVDRDAQEIVAELGRALDAPAPEPDAVAALAGRIGQAVCSGCHLVHVPAATAQALGAAAEAGR